MSKAAEVFEKLAKKKCKKKKKKSMPKMANKAQLSFEQISKIYKHLADNAPGLSNITKVKMRAKSDAALLASMKNAIKRTY